MALSPAQSRRRLAGICHRKLRHLSPQTMLYRYWCSLRWWWLVDIVPLSPAESQRQLAGITTPLWSTPTSPCPWASVVYVHLIWYVHPKLTSHNSQLTTHNSSSLGDGQTHVWYHAHKAQKSSTTTMMLTKMMLTMTTKMTTTLRRRRQLHRRATI
jgi:hypothetical protein